MTISHHGRTGLLITGASGRIGGEFISRFSADYDLRLTDLAEPTFEMLHTGEWFVGDLSDMDFAEKVTSGIDAVLHLAAASNPSTPFEVLLPSNIAAAYNIFDAALRSGVRRLVFASSVQAVTGHSNATPIMPDMPPRPLNVYGATKAWGEALCSVYARKGMSCYALRIGDVRDSAQLRGWAHDEMMREFIDIDDLCALLKMMIDTNLDSSFEIFQGVSDNAAKRMDISKSQKMLGYCPKHGALPPDILNNR